MIRVEGLRFTYPGNSDETLRGLDFAIAPGEILGFLGPSGSGKSTTQKILIGLLPRYSGSVVVLGGLALVAVAGLPTAPFMALLIAGFANNQVEGFAVMKVTGFLIMAPLASFFIHQPWDLLVGVVPVFWPIKTYFALVDGSTDLFWLALLLSLIYPSLCVLWLYRRFRNRAVAAS
jgi:hypothetical protein